MKNCEVKQILRERMLKINLSDEEIEDLGRMAGAANLTVAELLENFVADLTASNRRNGSDECDYADTWFERCGFDNYAEQTFLRYVLTEHYDIDGLLATWNCMNSFAEDLKEAADSGEMTDIQESFNSLKEDIQEVYDGYVAWCKQEPATLERCMEQVAKWQQEQSLLKYGPCQ